MKVSIVIPLYNKGPHIRRALDSVLAQSYGDFEIVVVDDGSKDDGPGRVQELTDSRIRLVSQVNAGPGAARNRGIAESTGELIAFLDADDEWMPNHLEVLMDLRRRFPDAGMYATGYKLAEDGRQWSPRFHAVPKNSEGGLIEDYFLACFSRLPTWTSATMVPKEVLAKVGNFNVQLMTGQDRELWIRVALYYRVAWSPMETAVYHLSAVNRRAGSISYPDAVHANTIESFLQSGIPSVSSRRSIEEYLVSMRLGLAKQNYVRGHEAWARELLRKTKETQLFSRHRRLCQLAFCFPPSCLKMLQSLHAFLHRVF